MVKFCAYCLCLIFHNKICVGDKNFGGQDPNSNDSKTIISLLDMLGFLWGCIQSTVFRIYPVSFSLLKVFN